MLSLITADLEHLLAHGGIGPEEVRRLHMEPGETLLVRVRDFTPNQVQEYQRWLEAVLPGIPVLVVLGEEMLTASALTEGA